MGAVLDRTRRFGLPVLALAMASFGPSAALGARPLPQNNASEQVSEIVATLATGQATIISGHDGLVVATVGNEFEPGSFPPLIVPLPSGDLAIVLGADDWTEPPPANRTLLRLDEQLPSLMRGMGGSAPSLTAETNIAHLKQAGLSVLEPLRKAAERLHEQIQLPSDLPLAELVLVRQTEDVPLVVWDVSYWIRQKFWEENFWSTEVERPRFMQMYPTKENKSRVVQVRYPPTGQSPGLMDWLSHPTGQLAQTIASDPKLAAAQKEIASGNAKKIHLAQLVPLVKSALDTMVPAKMPKALIALSNKGSFTWIIEPAAAKVRVKRPPGAPTLEKTPNSH